MKLDPTKMKDWQIAEAAEENLKPIKQLAGELGLTDDELLPMGRQLAKVDYIKVLERLKCSRCDTPAERRAYLQHQRLCGRRGTRPVHTAYPAFYSSDR